MNPNTIKPKNTRINIYPNIQDIKEDIKQIEQCDAQSKDQSLRSREQKYTASNYQSKEPYKKNLHTQIQQLIAYGFDYDHNSSHNSMQAHGIEVASNQIPQQRNGINNLSKNSPTSVQQNTRSLAFLSEFNIWPYSTQDPMLKEREIEQKIMRNFQKKQGTLKFIIPYVEWIEKMIYDNKQLMRIFNSLKMNNIIFLIEKSQTEQEKVIKKVSRRWNALSENLFEPYKKGIDYNTFEELITILQAPLTDAAIALRNSFAYQIKFIKNIVKYFKSIPAEQAIFCIKQFAEFSSGALGRLIAQTDSLALSLAPRSPEPDEERMFGSMAIPPESAQYKTNIVITNQAILDLLSIIKNISIIEKSKQFHEIKELSRGIRCSTFKALYIFFTYDYPQKIQHDRSQESEQSNYTNLLLRYYFTSKIKEKLENLPMDYYVKEDIEIMGQIIKFANDICKDIKSKLLQNINNQSELQIDSRYSFIGEALPNEQEENRSIQIAKNKLINGLKNAEREIFEESAAMPSLSINTSNSILANKHTAEKIRNL